MPVSGVGSEPVLDLDAVQRLEREGLMHVVDDDHSLEWLCNIVENGRESILHCFYHDVQILDMVESTLLATGAIESTLDVSTHGVNLFDDEVCVLLLGRSEHHKVIVWVKLLKQVLDSRSHAKLLVLAHPVASSAREARESLPVVHQCLVKVKDQHVLPWLVHQNSRDSERYVVVLLPGCWQALCVVAFDYGRSVEQLLEVAGWIVHHQCVILILLTDHIHKLLLGDVVGVFRHDQVAFLPILVQNIGRLRLTSVCLLKVP